MQKQKLRNNKIKGNITKRINTKNLPIFILIGLIAMIIIIAVIYYVFLRYSPEQIITYQGYAIEGKTMAENLKSSEVSSIDQYLNLIEVKENDLLYKRLNSYYIGENDKKEIDMNYPMYINEGNTLFNISRNTKLMTVNYEEVEGYPEFMLTGGVMYNGGDLTRADGNQYIFLKSEDEIYTNVGKIKIKTATNEYEIKEYSNIYFTEEAIAYYEMQDGYMQYKRIADIDNNSEIEVNGETLTYKTFLERLGIINSEENNKNNRNEVENTINENVVSQETEQTESNQEENSNSEQTENEWQEGMWEKPEVSCTDFESDVYTIKTNLTVVDRANVITRGIVFEVSLDGRLNRRVQATKTGKLEITGLQPDTTYEIVGIVYYNDESGVEIEEEFYTGSVTTKSIDTLGTIDFSFENGEIYPNKIELIHLKINNDVNEEVIKGISRLQLEIDGIAYRLTNDQIDQVKAGEEITYQTSETIESNSTIRYEITAFDKFGNELKEINNTGETITSKQAPSTSIRATKQDVTEVNLEISLTNKDNVLLENYRYEIVNQSGDVVKNGTLNENNSSEILAFTDLDPNGYYQIIIYGDYDLENGDGKQLNQELGRGSFVTRPIASLGYIRVNIDDKEVTQDSMKLGVSIDSNQTDTRLIAILDKVEVVIYDEGKNINQNNGENVDEQENNEIKRITLTEEEVKQLKTAEKVEINLDQLNSNTIYRIDVITTVKQGSVEEVVEDKQNIDQLITLKMPAEVQIRNQFVIGDMIDLDIRVEDLDNAILTQSVRIEVRDEDNKLVNLSEMATNGDYERKTYENLKPNTTYRIIIYAPQYNEGSTDETYHADYILKELKILTEAGISGKLDLLSLEKTPSGKNLIDVSSKINWYERCFNTAYKYGLNYDENNKLLTLGGSSASNQRNYYDLSNYIGQEITISFKARTQDVTQMSIIEKKNDDFNDTVWTTYYTINDIVADWKEYSYTVTLNSTGYIGFYVVTNNAEVEIQDLQIELGNKKTAYEEFKYKYNANIGVTVNDVRNEINTNDYYICIYKNDEQIEEIRYDELGEENKIENVLKTYEIDVDATYRIELLVKVQDRYYILDSQKFTTEGSKVIKGISSINDYLKIQPYGEYIVLNDFDVSSLLYNNIRFGSDELEFNGTINFNGKTITRDTKNNSNMFRRIGANGILENLVLEIKINNTTESSLAGLLVNNNYGIIKNIRVDVTEAVETANSSVYLIANDNTGVIDNFIINLQEPIYVYSRVSLVTFNNYGTIKNGYLYGENIKISGTSSELDASGIAYINRYGGVIENIYSLINIDSEIESNRKVNILVQNDSNSVIQNIYSVGVGENTKLESGPNVGVKSSTKIYNNYYFADEIFTSSYETKGNTLSLWDAEFQNQLINGDGAFIVDDLVNEGYYPWINMPEVMPTQDYIELPEVEDADLPDILSTKILEQGTDTVKVEFSVNNPSSETISNIQIENLEVEIISQEYNAGKSTVIAELKNPIICVSRYNVLSISTRGAFNNTYTRQYEEGERVINVDLYNEIWNINDWKNISSSENYMLMADLDFINEENSIYISRVDGKINGNGFTISNINITGNRGLIGDLYGSLENLYITNFRQETDNYGGLVISLKSEASIDNVHMSNVYIVKRSGGNVGGLVNSSSGGNIYDSSIKQLEIICDMDNIPSNFRIGGIVGTGGSTVISNCYVYDIFIDDTKATNSSVGGIIGYDNNSTTTIRNCYAEGKIISENSNVGGIIGSVVGNGTSVENCYTKVNISTSNSFVGGIIGLSPGYELNTVANNLSIGNLYTTLGIDSLNRIVGSALETENDNYSYEKQLLNGYISLETKGATLLDEKEILNLNIGDSYNYDKKEDGILPKLYNTEGTELLPNQEDIYLEENTESNIVLEVESIEATKPNTSEAEINIRINNLSEVQITGIEIEDMTSEITRNVTQNGITNITVKATPNRFYDSYKLTEIRYQANNSEEEQVKEVETEIKVQFYKEIYTYEDWQSIEEGIYQNYRLMADIDFSGRSNVKNNILVNRLEAENNIYTLKNISLEFGQAGMGLINNVKTSIKNIGFENITLTNTAGSGEYFGVICSNNGNIENLKFNNVTIDGNGISYTGIIGGTTSGNINNIELQNITVRGRNYTGGVIGNVNVSLEINIMNILGDNITVESNGNYVGGGIGYLTGSLVEASNVTILNSNIKGNDYTGGIIGMHANGTLDYLKTEGTTISGNSYVGGIAGRLNGAWYVEVNNSIINCTGSNIGGITGHLQWSSRQLNYVSADDLIINVLSENSKNIGGIMGVSVSGAVQQFQIKDLRIYGHGTNVGGVGNGSSESITYGFSAYVGILENVYVEGKSNIGGIAGWGLNCSLHDIIAEANVKAYINTAGGVIGYIDNSQMTASYARSAIYRTLVINSYIEAPTKAGGLIGDIATEIYRVQSFYYSNYIDADVTSENESTGSLIIGGRPTENQYITNTYVYKYSKLNEDYVYATNDRVDNDKYLVRADLDKQSTFQNKIGLGTTYCDYASLQEGKYPMIKDTYLYHPELQEGVDLPIDPSIVDLNAIGTDNENDTNTTEPNSNDISTQSLEVLPEVNVYPVSVNEINIDFSSIPERVNFTYYINGQEIETIDLNEKTYTFEYNFEDELKLFITNGADEETITINPSDIRSEISLVGDNYAYLLGNNLYINGEVQSGEYINVYEGLAMIRSSSQILDIVSGQIVESSESRTRLEETAKPLHTYEYKENSIEVFGTYSKIDGNVKLQIYNVISGKLSAISNNLDMKIDNYIVDQYNDKEYQTILTNSGEIVDLKESLKYPSNFLNRNVKQIVQNSAVDNTEMMVLYNTGKVIVFNYVNGNILYENSEQADSGLANYITGSINSIWSDYESKQSEYLRSKELVTKLSEMPIEEVLGERNDNSSNSTIENIDNINNTNTISNEDSYITVYNGETGEYEVYSESEILEGTEEEPVSETEKIKENGLEGIYNYEEKEETGTKVNGAIIVIVIIVIAIISLVILRKLIYRNNQKNNNK